MHGIIFFELEKFVKKNYNLVTWQELLNKSGVENKVFDPTKPYSDEEALKLITTASAMTAIPVDTLLEKFGYFIVPDLFKFFGHMMKKEWKTLGLLEYTESVMHKAVRINNPGATPPTLVIKRNRNEVTIHYNSKRQMVSLGVGIIKGIGDHFQENLQISVKKDTANQGSIITVREVKV
jgi:hypothetical protein